MRVDGSKILNPGLARHQITWQEKRVTAQNSFGEDVYTWSDVVTLRARVRSLGGRELAQARQMWPDARYEIEQPYYAGLDPMMQISWYVDGSTTKTLDVLDIQDQPGSGRYQIVLAKDHGD